MPSFLSTAGIPSDGVSSTLPYFKGETYAEQVREILAVGGDPTFLEPPTTWDGSVDESAHFGGWEVEATTPLPKRKVVPAKVLSYAEQKKEIEAVGGDPSFLDDTPSSVWDGSVDESAYFGGWES